MGYGIKGVVCTQGMGYGIWDKGRRVYKVWGMEYGIRVYKVWGMGYGIKCL